MFTKDLIKEINNSNLNFAKTLRKDYHMEKNDSSPEAFADIITILKIVFNFDDEKIKKEEMITDGKKDGSIDCVVINKNKNKIYLFDVKGGNSSFDYKPLKEFLDNFKTYILDEDSDLSALNSRVNKKLEIVKNLYHNYDWKIKLIIARPLFNKNPDPSAFKKFRNLCKDDCGLEYDFINLKKLEEYISNKKERKEYMWKVKIKNLESIKTGRKKLTNLIGKVEIKQIIDLIKEHEEKNIFDNNVRVYQKDEFFTAKIKNTIKEKGDQFYIYHNGLTLSASEITSKGTTYNIKNPQIINGCQSVSAIHKLIEDKKINLNELKKCYVLCKIFSSESQEFINEICQSANTQRPIYTWDLRTNDAAQKLIEKFLNLRGYIYVRKKTRGEKGILMTELGQWLYSCIEGEPAKAKSDKSSLFDISGKYRSIFDLEVLSAEQIKKICEIALFVKEIIKEEKKDKEKKSFYKNADFHIMAILFNKYKGEPNKKNFNEAIKLIKVIIKKMRKKYGDEYSYNYIFKNPETWELIKKTRMS